MSRMIIIVIYFYTTAKEIKRKKSLARKKCSAWITSLIPQLKIFTSLKIPYSQNNFCKQETLVLGLGKKYAQPASVNTRNPQVIE